MRYHPLCISPEEFTSSLKITARSPADEIIMGLEHGKFPIYGIQFHPESFGTPCENPTRQENHQKTPKHQPMLKKTLFNTVIYKGTVAAVYGIVAGLLLGLLIWALLQVSLMINNSISIAGPIKGDVSYAGPPFEFFVMMGMCFGAIIGSVFGSITALKEEKRK